MNDIANQIKEAAIEYKRLDKQYEKIGYEWEDVGAKLNSLNYSRLYGCSH